MTPKEKAKELIDKFLKHTSHPLEEIGYNRYHAKKCALICVDEIIESLPFNQFPKMIFLQEVKGEIEKL